TRPYAKQPRILESLAAPAHRAARTAVHGARGERPGFGAPWHVEIADERAALIPPARVLGPDGPRRHARATAQLVRIGKRGLRLGLRQPGGLGRTAPGEECADGIRRHGLSR